MVMEYILVACSDIYLAPWNKQEINRQRSIT